MRLLLLVPVAFVVVFIAMYVSSGNALYLMFAASQVTFDLVLYVVIENYRRNHPPQGGSQGGSQGGEGAGERDE